MRPRQDIPPDLTSAAYMGHDLGAPFHQSFAVRAQRADFQAQPPKKQFETMARVTRLIAQYPNSYLARHWREIYGIREEMH